MVKQFTVVVSSSSTSVSSVDATASSSLGPGSFDLSIRKYVGLGAKRMNGVLSLVYQMSSYLLKISLNKKSRHIQ